MQEIQLVGTAAVLAVNLMVAVVYVVSFLVNDSVDLMLLRRQKLSELKWKNLSTWERCHHFETIHIKRQISHFILCLTTIAVCFSMSYALKA